MIFQIYYLKLALWVNKLDMLSEYIKYKYTLQFYGSNFKSDKIKIEDKIK